MLIISRTRKRCTLTSGSIGLRKLPGMTAARWCCSAAFSAGVLSSVAEHVAPAEHRHGKEPTGQRPSRHARAPTRHTRRRGLRGGRRRERCRPVGPRRGRCAAAHPGTCTRRACTSWTQTEATSALCNRRSGAIRRLIHTKRPVTAPLPHTSQIPLECVVRRCGRGWGWPRQRRTGAPPEPRRPSRGKSSDTIPYNST